MEFSTEDDDAGHHVPTKCLTEQELRVAEILLRLSELFRQCESRKRCYSSLNLRWATKRKRLKRSRRPIDAVGPAAAPAPAPSLGPNEPGPSKAWTDASSPDTPLIATYSGGSSDPKSGAVATSKRTSVKRTTEELRLAESAAQRERERLEGEIKILGRRIEREKSLNRDLKRAQKLLITRLGNEKAQLENVDTSLTLGVLSLPSAADAIYPHFGILDVPEPLAPNRTAIGVDKSSNLIVKGKAVPSLRPLAALLSLSVDPPPVLDLNLPEGKNGVGVPGNPGPRDHMALDSRFFSRAAAAKARQRRYFIIKAKLRR